MRIPSSLGLVGLNQCHVPSRLDLCAAHSGCHLPFLSFQFLTRCSTAVYIALFCPPTVKEGDAAGSSGGGARRKQQQEIDAYIGVHLQGEVFGVLPSIFLSSCFFSCIAGVPEKQSGGGRRQSPPRASARSGPAHSAHHLPDCLRARLWKPPLPLGISGAHFSLYVLKTTFRILCPTLFIFLLLLLLNLNLCSSHRGLTFSFSFPAGGGCCLRLLPARSLTALLFSSSKTHSARQPRHALWTRAPRSL